MVSELSGTHFSAQQSAVRRTDAAAAHMGCTAVPENDPLSPKGCYRFAGHSLRHCDGDRSGDHPAVKKFFPFFGRFYQNALAKLPVLWYDNNISAETGFSPEKAAVLS